MNKNLTIAIIIAVVVVVIVLGAVWYFMQIPTVDNQVGVTPKTPQQVTVTLSEQNSSSVSGRATLTQVAGGVKVVLSLGGTPVNVSQPAHIHLNNCANIGAIKYPLNPSINGSSETIINTTLAQLLNSLPLSINIHKSASEVSTYVACGNIVAP